MDQLAYAHFRDRVPHVLGMGLSAWKTLEHLESFVKGARDELSDDSVHHFDQSCRVIRQVIRTASITAPPSLWLARYVIEGLRRVGLGDQLLSGATLNPFEIGLTPGESETDLCFLTVLGILDRHEKGFRLTPSLRARRLFVDLPSLPVDHKADLAAVWSMAFGGKTLTTLQRDQLLIAVERVSVRKNQTQETHCPTLEEVLLGHQLVPIVLGMQVGGVCGRWLELDGALSIQNLIPGDMELSERISDVLRCSGICEGEEALVLTPIGQRVLERGPGPFGIIEAYHPYMDALSQILESGRGRLHLTRGSNVAASQRANRKSFRHANASLDAFCKETGFEYSVYIEHALGRGEATRQRYEACGDALQYVGADLEDEAIDAALEEQAMGHLPDKMLFVRQADIGQPERLLQAMKAVEIDARDAVMVVGNGFHEIREQSDDGMVAVLAGYCQAGIVLLFTEETALSVQDQIDTGWNTYHPAFRYVHEKSGQGLRPAKHRPLDHQDEVMPVGWTECARRAGYVKLEAYSRRGRTIFPCPTASGHNPSISQNYFLVPVELATRLEITG